jgi:hypothetical protein
MSVNLKQLRIETDSFICRQIETVVLVTVTDGGG